MTWKKMMIDMSILKKVHKAYGRDNNGQFREEINLLLVGLSIIKKMQKAYGRNGNGH